MKNRIVIFLHVMMASGLAVPVFAGPPPAPNVSFPTAGSSINTNRPDITFTGGTHDQYEVHIGLYNVPTSAEGWNSGTVTDSGFTATSGALATQQTYYVFVRNHNSDGWGPWSPSNVHFYVDGQLLNDPYLVAASGGQTWQHTMCYNPTRNEYLIAYMSYPPGPTDRRVIEYYRLDSTGTKIGSAVDVIDNLEGSGGPSVCYNSAHQEYLIPYSGFTSSGGLHDELRYQRVNAITGALIGVSTWVRSSPTGIDTKVAYSPTSDSYLLIWEDQVDVPWPVYGLRLSGTTGLSLGSIFHISNGTTTYAGNPAIAYNLVNDEYMVSFQTYTEADPNSCWNLYTQRVRASDGALLGGNITIDNTTECDTGSNIAYDSDLNRYLLVYEGGTPTPWAQFVSNIGTLVGTRISIGTGGITGGMTNVAWNSSTKEWLVTWASCCSADNYARRLSQTGDYIGELFQTNGAVQGFGNWDPTPVYSSANNEFLICWFWQYANVYVRRFKPYPPPVDTTAPSPVTGLTLQRFPSSIILNWTNPSTADFMGTKILYKTTGFPTGPTDGVEIADLPNAPSTPDTLTHTGLVQGTTYYYAVFAHDEVPNYATATQGSAKIFAEDFDGDGDVDMIDFAHLQNCLSGAGIPYDPGCTNADIDEDGDVDQSDVALFLPCLAGANQPPGC